MPESYDELKKKYEILSDEIENEIENLKYLLDNIQIENINLINIHFKIKDLLSKKEMIKNELYDEYNELILDE